MLYDIEFLQDESGRRVSAIGHWAGFVGAGEGVRGLAEKVKLWSIHESEMSDMLFE
jgi:saccharopine dehydrogenase (NAD+, L-lysine forming)